MKPARVMLAKWTSGIACHAFSETTLVSFIVNEHTTEYTVTHDPLPLIQLSK